MALQNVDILHATEQDLKKKMKNVRVDGGAAVNDLLLQMQADYLGRRIIRPRMIETTVAGAAYLAGLGIGFWSNLSDIKKVWQVEREFEPQLSSKGRTVRLRAWQNAI